MEILDFIWSEILYKPFFNLLIFLYAFSPGPNLGWAIAILSVLVRLLFLPLSIKGYRTDTILDSLAPQIKVIEESEKLTSKEKRSELSRLVKSRNIDLYAEIWSLLGQVAFIVILYQVVQTGIKPVRLEDLYSFTPHPSAINAEFFGTDILHPSAFWSTVASVVLFLELLWEYTSKKSLSYGRFSERWLPLLFPVFTFILLMMLPATKAIFILASVIFSLVLRFTITLALRSKG